MKDGQDCARFKAKFSCLETFEAYKILLTLFIQRPYYDDRINDTLQSLGKELQCEIKHFNGNCLSGTGPDILVDLICFNSKVGRE